jgi:hypothetical protein
MLLLEKYSRREEATNVDSSTKVTHVPYRNHEFSYEKLWFVRSLYQTCPKWDKKYHGKLVPFHDTMPSFMNFRQDLYLQGLKNQVSQCL